MRRRNLLGVDICATDYAGACAAVRSAAIERRPFALSALAVHGVMTGVLDPVHRRRLNALDMVLPDGQPVRWGINALYSEGLSDRVCGPQLMLDVCAMAEREGLSVGFYGNKETVLAELQRRLRKSYPELRIAASIPSRFCRVDPVEQAALARTIAGSGTDILFVGLGCPRQEDTFGLATMLPDWIFGAYRLFRPCISETGWRMLDGEQAYRDLGSGPIVSRRTS